MIEIINRSNKILTTLQINYQENVKDPDASYYAESIGKLPFVVINGVQIEAKDIRYFKLSNEKFLPTIEIIFTDPTNKLIDSKYPLDLQICNLLIKSNESLLMPIRMDFWIYSFTTIKNKGGISDYKKYHLLGELDVPVIVENKSFKGNSYDVLKTLTEKSDLGFASNIQKTNDSMNWINIGIDNIREFVPEIVKHGYIDDNSFVWAYVDFWYNLNYIDIEKQLNLSTKGDRALSGNESLTGKAETIPLVLSNHPDYNMTNQYFDIYNLLNESTNVNWEIGYKPWVYYYQTKERNLVGVLLDTLSYKGSQSDKIVLKGQPEDDSYAIGQQRNYFMGKNDTDNSHENYLYAELLNKNNLKFLQKVRMTIVLKKLNFQLYRFQPINLQIYKLRELDNDPNPVTQQERESGKNMDKYKLNERLSGDWIITGINFVYIRRGNTDIMTQEITVARRELSAAKIAKNN